MNSGAAGLVQDEVRERHDVRRRQPVEHGQPLFLERQRRVQLRLAAEEGAHRRGGRLAEAARRAAAAVQRQGRAERRRSARPRDHCLRLRDGHLRGDRDGGAHQGGGGCCCGGGVRVVFLQHLVLVVHEVAARSVRAEANRVEGATELSLVLRVSGQAAQLRDAVRELALVTVLAHAELFVWPGKKKHSSVSV